MSGETRRCGMGSSKCRGWALGPDGKRAAALLSTPAGICEACEAWLGRVVSHLPIGWLKLELTIGEHRAPHSEKTRRPRPGSRIPLNVTTDALMRDIEDVLLQCAKTVANEMHMALRMYPGNSNYQMYRRVRHYAGVVSSNIDKLIANADSGVDMAKRLVELERQLVRHIGETAQRERKHLPCPVCGAQGLVKEVRDMRGREYHSHNAGGNETPEVIRCTNCDGEWTEAEYDWFSHMVLSEREELDMVEWLLAEARWQRDVNAWLAAEGAWLLQHAARSIGSSYADLTEALRKDAATWTS